uniref:Uncharacterized protein n=1 Tax=Amphimedon queenslandica TaxID=400682 RepID=A0A1X7UUE8_AMPQE
MVKSKAGIAYKISKKFKIAYAKSYSMKFHALNPGYVLQKSENWYNKKKDAKISKSICYSKNANPVPKKIKLLNYLRATYSNDPQQKQQQSRDSYQKKSEPPNK